LAKAHRFTGTRCLGDRWFERQAADQPARLETECDVSGAVRRYRLPIGRQPCSAARSCSRTWKTTATWELHILVFIPERSSGAPAAWISESRSLICWRYPGSNCSDLHRSIFVQL